MMVNLLTLPPPSDKTIVSLIWQQIWQARCTNLFVVEESLCLILLSLSLLRRGSARRRPWSSQCATRRLLLATHGLSCSDSATCPGPKAACGGSSRWWCVFVVVVVVMASALVDFFSELFLFLFFFLCHHARRNSKERRRARGRRLPGFPLRGRSKGKALGLVAPHSGFSLARSSLVGGFLVFSSFFFLFCFSVLL